LHTIKTRRIFAATKTHNMSKIAKSAAKALINKAAFNRGNTEVLHSALAEDKACKVIGRNESALWLYRSKIARFYYSDRHTLELSCWGYATQTTKDRLNAVLHSVGIQDRFATRKGLLYLGDDDAPIGAKDVVIYYFAEHLGYWLRAH